MNKTINSLFSQVVKPIAKAVIPFALTFGSYQSSQAQSVDCNLNKYTVPVVFEKKFSESLDVDVCSFLSPIEKSYHLDVIQVYHPGPKNRYKFLYLGNIDLVKGDSLLINIVVHEYVNDSIKRSRTWTDKELTDIYFTNDCFKPANPENERSNMGVITDIISIKPGK